MGNIKTPAPIGENYTLRPLTLADETLLQQLCEKCPDYYDMVNGEPPEKCEARDIMTELPPDKTPDDKFVFGVFHKDGTLAAAIDVVRNFPSRDEWIIGLLLIEPSHRSQGLGRKLHDYLVDWAQPQSLKKFRIGVVEQNQNAIEFWKKMGYYELKRVGPVQYGRKESMVIVMNYALK